ncbi:DUF4468 domain-containing protein [Phocaeicola coprophilus]|uniref:DUF4468 domain-containing protein n=1 Tax=Phocaeicola coprophilus TaxID=387090 RepID=UPI0039966C3F
MKKLFLILLAMFPIIAFSQNKANFIFKSDAAYHSADGNRFIVFEYPNMSKNELFNKIYLSASKLYTNPDKVISKVDGELISLHGISGNCIKWGQWSYFSVEYVIKFQFKDNKIRVDVPEIVNFYNDDGRSYGSPLGWLRTQRIFTEEKTTDKEIVIKGFEDAVNDVINSVLYNAFNDDNDW